MFAIRDKRTIVLSSMLMTQKCESREGKNDEIFEWGESNNDKILLKHGKCNFFSERKPVNH